MNLITTDRMDALACAARADARQRANDNLHPRLDDPVQRFLNAFEPGSYVRPHRHSTPAGWEMFIVLAGRAAVLIFDDGGTLSRRVELDAAGPVLGAEIPAGAWHSVVALESKTVLFELKPGPYHPVTDKDFAPWAPAEGDPAAALFREWLSAIGRGQDIPMPAPAN